MPATQTQRTWRRSRIPAILPGITPRMYDHWGRVGHWWPDIPPVGSGHNAQVTLADLEGLAVLQVLAPFLFKQGGHERVYPTAITCPPWPEIRRACEEGGVWIAATEGFWQPWSPTPIMPSVAGVVVDVGALVGAVRARIEETS